MSRILATAVIALALAACPTTRPAFVECEDHSSCGLRADGECRVHLETGHQFCVYPDARCASGWRWSDLDVEASISGRCVEVDVPIIDANDSDVDAGPPPDADSCPRSADDTASMTATRCDEQPGTVPGCRACAIRIQGFPDVYRDGPCCAFDTCHRPTNGTPWPACP
jgi:hypothetical protein